MKYVIILLLSTSGLEQIKYPLKKSFLEKYPKEYSVLACGDQADEWRLNNTTYYDHKNNDAKQQGNYTKDGKLMIGSLCE
jgi:hypothetical protein|tara:strand:+ start:816 stop:1055 length:240 start_codon:yes stop_codon:yes gene_type:complete